MASGFGAGVGMAHLQGILIHLDSIFFWFLVGAAYANYSFHALDDYLETSYYNSLTVNIAPALCWIFKKKVSDKTELKYQHFMFKYTIKLERNFYLVL